MHARRTRALEEFACTPFLQIALRTTRAPRTLATPLTGNCDQSLVVCTPRNCATVECVVGTGCVYTNITCPSSFCTIGQCSATTGQCSEVPDTSLACQCTNVATACTATSNFCFSAGCYKSLSDCLTIADSANQAACNTSIAGNTRFCYSAPKNACPADACNTYTCNPTTSQCDIASTTSCPNTNICLQTSCDKTRGCFSVNSTAPNLCNDQNICTQDSCDVNTGSCVNTRIVSATCAQCTNTTCPATTDLCNPISCISNCASPGVVNVTACTASVAAVGTYCQTLDIQATQCTPRNDACSTFNCNPANGQCVATLRNCPAPNNCTVSVCSVATGGCVNSDRCLGAVIPDRCRAPRCISGGQFPNGFTCDDPSAPLRNCSDYFCSATNVTRQILLGPAADQFLQQYASLSPRCVPRVCTVDSCDPSVGCVNLAVSCSVNQSSCNATLGCFEIGNAQNFAPGFCQEQLIQSLVDFCGVCKGDNAACFFAAVNSAAVAGGIAGGVIAAIVIAAIIAALLAFFLSKKGYDYYQAQSQLNSAALQNNPAFQDHRHQGTMA